MRGVERSLVVTPNETITLSADAGSSGEIKVVSNVPWRATDNRDWITNVSPSSGTRGTTTVNINWNRNTTTSERTGRISFMSTDPGVAVLMDGVNVSQQGGMAPPFIRSSPRDDEVVESAGTYTFMIDSNRSWRSRKTRSSDWVTLNPNSGSSGTTAVVATYSANAGPNRRSERWEFTTDGDPSDGASFVLNQIVPGTVLLTINPTSELVFMDAGGMANREITSNVSWSVVNSTAGSDIPGWLTVSPSMGSSSQTITITCSSHTQSSQRRVVLQLQSRGVNPQVSTNIVIRQTGRSARSLEGPGTITLPPTVGMRTFDVRSNTSWEITKNAAWITNINPSTGSNNRRVEITFIANPETTERQTTLVLRATVSGVNISRNIVITQSGAAAPFLSGPTTISVPSAEGRRQFAISSNVDWEIVGFPSWITSFIPSRTGNGNAMVDFVYQANPNQVERTATFRLEEVTSSTPVTPAMIEVKQAPRIVVNQRSLSVTPTQNTLPPIMGSVNLTLSSTIPWRATGMPDWVTLSPTSGIAGATVKLTHQANASTSPRNAMITFRNTDTGTSIIRSVNISQGGGMERTLSVSDTQVNLLSTRGSRQLMVSSNIPWVMEENIAWITLSETSGTTTATVTVSYEANSASTPRSGIITLRNNDGEAVLTHTINISQVGIPQRALVVTPTQLNLPPTTGSTMFTVTSTNVSWRIEKDIAWVTPDQADGIASATVVLTYQANSTANPRDGTITFRSSDSGSPITVVIDVSQAGRTSRVFVD